LVTIYEEDISVLPGDDFSNSNVVVPDVDVFGASLGDRVRSDENRTLVVPTDWDWLEVISTLPHKGMHPDYLTTAIRECHVFSLGGGQGNSLLCLCCP